ncbi:MAG: GGDEF domain-containing protein, partial [Actinomycetota bacterium]|nr:GGDEF domain-containing protein [Actinomycetota bacterium]
GDTVCRLGGDEFAVLLADRTAAQPTARRLAALLSDPVDLGDVQVQVGASVGIASGLPGEPFDELLQRADRAMYEAKGRSSASRCSGFGRPPGEPDDAPLGVPGARTGEAEALRSVRRLREVDVQDDRRAAQTAGAAAR